MYLISSIVSTDIPHHPNIVIEKLKKIEERLQKRTSFVSNTQSRAEKVKSLKTEGLLKPSMELDAFLEELQVDWWPTEASTEFPVVGGESVSQSFVSDLLELFTTGKVVVKQLNKKKQSPLLSKVYPILRHLKLLHLTEELRTQDFITD